MSDCKDEVMKAEGAKKTEEEGARALEGQDKPPEDGRVYFRDEESGLWWEDIGRDPTSATYRDAETDLLISARDDKKGGSSYKVFMESNKAKASLPTPRLSSAGAGDGAAALLSAEIINDKLAKAAARRQSMSLVRKKTAAVQVRRVEEAAKRRSLAKVEPPTESEEK